MLVFILASLTFVYLHRLQEFGYLVSPNINQIARTTCKVSNTSVAVPDLKKNKHPKRF